MSPGTVRGPEAVGVASWLPPGKTCAICFSIDDVHPGRADLGFDAGGDLAAGALGHVLRLAEAHAELRTTLCVTPDWRARSPYPTRRLLAALPGLARYFYLSERWPAGTMRLDRHPQFIDFLRAIPRAEIVPHGLHHIQKGHNGPVEFENADYEECRDALTRIDSIMAAAGVEAVPGHSPPGWAAPEPLRRAMRDHGLRFIASARDVRTPIAPGALTAMSGLSGQPLIAPGLTPEGLVHIPANFQATSEIDRAFAILDVGGLLSIKAHVAKRVGSYVALDGLDDDYTAYLDTILARCTDRHGDGIWWASMGEIAERVLGGRIRQLQAIS
jgi:peptidoglycan/xylan/chitin deacetylase (PgdA/CDA1 family)